ncbi:hypothetical protein [Muricoccus nepalensis]|nr:hypothetical protein [Roseomonas nepalensis]
MADARQHARAVWAEESAKERDRLMALPLAERLAALDDDAVRQQLTPEHRGELRGAIATLAEAGKASLSDADKATYLRDVRGFLHQGLARLPRQMVVRTAVIAGLTCAGMTALGVAGGYLAGRASVMAEVSALNRHLALDAEAAAAWLDLIQLNGDPRPALSRGTKFRPDIGGEATSLNLWLRAPPAVPPQRR